MKIIPIGPLQNSKIDQNIETPGKKNTVNFKKTISNYVNEVNDLQLKAGE